MKLSELADRPGSRKARRRVGRGIGSGKGKTAGRGVKGQKARSGVAVKGFEGGQMPLHRRLPKRGFKSLFAKDYNEINLGRVQQAIDAGKLDPAAPVDAAALVKAGVLRRAKDGVRLLGDGE
ncbi:MAG: 50S ribosomal protein L15, partial [Xanthobacteraceae bacterium]